MADNKRKVYQVFRRLYPAEKRHPMMAGVDVGVYAGYFESEERAEEFADKVGGWVGSTFIETDKMR